MNLISVEQPFIFPGLNGDAVDFLLHRGKWFPYEDGEGAAGLIIDSERYDPNDKYRSVTGLYTYNKAIVARTYEVIVLGQDEEEMALYKYKLEDDSWVWEVIDRVVADIKPVLCLVDEYKQKAFKWSDEEIEEAILFMIENDLM
jgi:hypothetical protein